MAVVMSGTAKTGAKWRIHDDAYINNTPERDMALARREREIAHDAMVQYARAEKGANVAMDEVGATFRPGNRYGGK